MLTVKEAIIVEGRYDKIKLSGIVNAPIIETGGFRVFSDKEKQSLIRQIAAKRGILVLTDSDGAGFVIRNFLRGVVPAEQIKHCYIPQIDGKEVIIRAIRQSGATVLGEETRERQPVTKADLCLLGLAGGENAAVRRQALLKELNLPTYLSANAMLTALNCLFSPEELCDTVAALEERGLM